MSAATVANDPGSPPHHSFLSPDPVTPVQNPRASAAPVSPARKLVLPVVTTSPVRRPPGPAASRHRQPPPASAPLVSGERGVCGAWSPLGEREQAIARVVVSAVDGSSFAPTRRTHLVVLPLYPPPLLLALLVTLCGDPGVLRTPQATRWLFVARRGFASCVARVSRIAASQLCSQLATCCWWAWAELRRDSQARVRLNSALASLPT